MAAEYPTTPETHNPNQLQAPLGQLSVALAEHSASQERNRAARIKHLDTLAQLPLANPNRAQEIRAFSLSLQADEVEDMLREFLARDVEVWDLLEDRNGLQLSNETALLLIQHDYEGVFFGRLDLFRDGLDASILYAIAPCMSHLDIDHISKFSNVDLDRFLDMLFDYRRIDCLFEVIKKYPVSGATITRMALRLIRENLIRTPQVDDFIKFDFDPAPVAQALVATNQAQLLARLLQERPTILDSALLVQAYANIALYDPSRSGRNPQDRHKYMQNICRCIAAILPHTKLEQDSKAGRIAFVYGRVKGMLGEHIEALSLSEVLGIYEGSPSPEMQELGITSAGVEGLNQLGAWAQNFPTYFHDDEMLVAMIHRSHFERQLFQRHIHFKDAPNTRATQLLFNERLSFFCDSEPKRLDSAFTPSRIYQIPRQYKEDSLSQDERARYTVLQQALFAAAAVAARGHGAISGWAYEFEQQLQYLDERLRASAADSRNANPTAQANITARRDQFRAIDTFSIAQFEQNFLSLVSSKAMHENLLLAMFTIALQRQRKSMPGWRQDLQERMTERLPLLPTIKSIAHLRTMVQDIQEYYNELFTTPQARKAFAMLSSTDALDAGLHRLNSITPPTVGVRFEPTRGLLMQYSDFIAQTCWLDLDPYFAKKHPGITTVMIRQEPGQKQDGLVGGFLLIHGHTKAGEQLLIARSINPRETWINSVQPEPFYYAAADYIRTQAAALNRTPVICLGGKVREFATNRPALHQHMPVGDPVKRVTDIVVTDDVNFNGYGSLVEENAFRL